MKIVNHFYLISMCIALVAHLVTIPFTVWLVIVESHLSARIFGGIFGVGTLASLIVWLVFARQWFSYFLLDEGGITNRMFWPKDRDIFIAWDEFQDIALVSMPQGRGMYTEYLYFCKMPVEEYFAGARYNKRRAKRGRKAKLGMAQDENIFTIDHSEKLMTEVLKHVDKDRIRMG